MADSEDKTRVTQVVRADETEHPSAGQDCLVVISTDEPTLLGKRFVLERSPTRIGRGIDNEIVLDADAVSRRHAALEKRKLEWVLIDDASTNGTTLNDERIRGIASLANGDRIRVGRTIFKFLAGADVEAQYHEEIYQMTIVDGLTQIHNKRHLLEALEREIVRARRQNRELALLMFDLDHFKRLNDAHGHVAGDFVLKELARVVRAHVRPNDLFARYGGEEFALVMPETTLETALELAETLRQAVARHVFVLDTFSIRVTISVGAATLKDGDRGATELIARADERLFDAKRAGRDRVVG